MNRIQFFVLTGLSSLIVLLLVGHIFLVRQTNFEQNRLAAAQQVINQGQAFQNNLKQLAIRIYSDSQKTNDQGLKDLLARQQISYTPASAAADNQGTPAPAPAPMAH
jgi:regulatory protein YycI of two-component signal transduction system YycFG